MMDDPLTIPRTSLFISAMGETSREMMEVALARAISIQYWHMLCLKVCNPAPDFG